MKFGKQIQSQQTPGWGQYYQDYKGLKKIINSLSKGRTTDAALLASGIRPPREPGPLDRLNSAEETIYTQQSNDNGGSLLSAHRAAFFFKLERELEKINQFYHERESSLKVRLHTLVEKRKMLQASIQHTRTKHVDRDNSSYVALFEGFKLFERDLGRLQAYVELNATAFRKILKKFDKAVRRQLERGGAAGTEPHDGQLYLARQVEIQPVFNRAFIARLSDVAADNVLQLEGLIGAGDGPGDSATDSDAAPEIVDIHAEERGLNELDEIEHALVSAVRQGDRGSAEPLLRSLQTARKSASAEVAHSISRILWRAVLGDGLAEGGRKPAEIGPDSGQNEGAARQNGAHAPFPDGKAPPDPPTDTTALTAHTLVLDLDDTPATGPTSGTLSSPLRFGSSLWTLTHSRNGSAAGPTASTLTPLIPFDILDYTYIDDISGRTCLHASARAGRVDLVEHCLDAGVDVAHADVYGRTALHYAALQGHAAVCGVLLAHGAHPRVADHDGYSAVVYAVTQGHADIVRALIGRGVAVESGSPELNSLSLACQHGHAEIVEILLAHGCQIAATPGGYYPQHLAAREGHARVLQILAGYSRGFAAIDIPDRYSQATPLIHASSEGHVECVKVLLQAGSDVHARDEFKKDALHYAAWQGHVEVVRLLLGVGGASGTAGAAGAADATTTMESLLRSDLAMDTESPHPHTSGNSGHTDDLDDLDADLIPSLSLPPPIIPFRIYGHNYLDKKCLVLLTLGHPNTSPLPTHAPVRFADPTHQSSTFKLVVTPRRRGAELASLSVILPATDEREVYSFQTETFEDTSIEFVLFPTFGSKMVAKAVAPSSLFRGLRAHGAYTVPLLDAHVRVVGELYFETTVVKPFGHAQLEIGGQFETYWKATAAEPRPAGPSPLGADLALEAPSKEPAVITASSLSGEFVRIVTQVTSDGVPVAYPHWFVDVLGVPVAVAQLTAAQFKRVASVQGTAAGDEGGGGMGGDGETQGSKGDGSSGDLASSRSHPASLGASLGTSLSADSSAADWSTHISLSMSTLSEVLDALPQSLGACIEVRYPTRSDVKRLELDRVLEVNYVTDQILATVYASIKKDASKRHRRIMFASFNPTVCLDLNWKQPNFSVFFASYCGLSRSSPDGELVPANRAEDDRRCTSIREAVKFAKANNLLGVLLDGTLLNKVPSVVRAAKENRLLVATFGTRSVVPLSDGHMVGGVLSYATTAFLEGTEVS